MSDKKIEIFKTIPDTELAKVGSTEDMQKLKNTFASIEKEFEQTNKHTKGIDFNTDNIDNIDNSVKESEENISTEIKPDKKNRLGKLMQGNFAVDLVDMLLPSLVVLCVNYIGYELNKKDIQLSKSEKDALAPAVQDVLDEIEIDFNNPYINLTIMLSIVYGSKIIDKLPVMKKKGKEDKKINEIEELKQIESNTDLTDIEKFEQAYNVLVDECKLKRRRGTGDAKEYLAKQYPEKIKKIMKLYNITDMSYLNFKWTPKKRESNKNEPFTLE